MSHNIANLSKDERDKVDVDLHASGIAYKERYGMPVSIRETENLIPTHLREYFNERLAHYREISKKLGKLPYEQKD